MKTFRTLVASCALLALAMLAHGDADTVKKELNAKYQALSKAFAAKDGAAFEKIVAPGFTTTDVHGKTIGTKEFISTMKQSMQALPAGAKVSARILGKVVSKGDKATCQSELSIVSPVPAGDGKSHTMSVTGVSEDTWVKLKGDWKVLKSVDKSQKMSMDGKPFDPSAFGQAQPGGARRKK